MGRKLLEETVQSGISSEVCTVSIMVAVQVLHKNSQANTEKEMPQRDTNSTRYLNMLKNPYTQNDVALVEWNRAESP